jgi:hypothetical protein
MLWFFIILHGHSKYHLIESVKLLGSSCLFLLPLFRLTAVAETSS